MNKNFESLKEKSILIKQNIITLYFVSKHPDLSLKPKLIILFIIGYAMSPIDLIPDFVPIIGYLDDIIIIPILISLVLKMIPQQILLESRQKAKDEKISLSNNWFFGVAFILLWIYLLVKGILFIIKIYN